MKILRMVPIERVELVRASLKAEGYKVRVRYRGPHGPHQDTLKKDARAASFYLL